MTAFEEYLEHIYNIRASQAAVKETAYYGALERLFNEVGKGLKPKVTFILSLQNKGAGIPDGGFFTASQLRKGEDVDWQKGQPPERGAVEVKGTGDDVDRIAVEDQVEKYLNKYGLVLVTNLRDFLLVGQDENGRMVKLERYKLAADEKSFWAAVGATPGRVAAEHGEGFVEYLRRVMLHNAPLSAPVDLAWFLASYAKDAKARIERASGAGLPAMRNVRAALEGALGLTFEGEKGNHFFRSTLVQTLFYGMFSAWVLWSKRTGKESKDWFDWKDAGWELQVPVIRSLFETLATKTKLDPLGLVEVMDWAGATLNRVNRGEFFARFEEEHAVQYFYEPFLEAFDPELRKDLGVWYTPPEIVKYMVERVDRVLREELGIEDGLADERVTVLDPACGTGAYLVEVLRRVERTLVEKGEEALLGYKVKGAALRRVFGFEILPAPFVVAHMQMGLLLQGLGAPLMERGSERERAGVYLTNSLTGWGAGLGPKQFPLEGLEEEREAAHAVKRGEEILVVIGNPPYNAFAGTSPEQEEGLVEVYKEGLIKKWGIKKFNLDDLYVRFFRLAERRITEMNRDRRGVVCYISNHSWVSDPSYVVLRQHLLESFDRFWVENMHGNRKISEYAPDGKTSETIFAIPGLSVGIQQGVAISLWVKSGKKSAGPKVLFRDDINAARAIERRAQLLATLDEQDIDNKYEVAEPGEGNRYSFRPTEISSDYESWPSLVDFSDNVQYQGLAEDRRKALIDTDAATLTERIKRYYDKNISWLELSAQEGPLTNTYVDFPAEEVRRKVLSVDVFRPEEIRRFAMRPFDNQYCYYTPMRPIWRRHRPEFYRQAWKGNAFITTRLKGSKDNEGPAIAYVLGLCDYHYLPPNVTAIPIQLRTNSISPTGQATLFEESTLPTANLSAQAREYLAGLGVGDPDGDAEKAGLVWMHALAIGYAPNYLEENADGIRQDWPRVPLPRTLEGLERSAALGREVAGLLDTEAGVRGVTTGQVRPEMRVIGGLQRVNGGQLNPDAGELDVTAGWGHGGKEGVTMPGKGRVVVRGYTVEEMGAIEEGAEKLGLTREQAWRHLGERTLDVYLNGVAYWRNVPEKVWEYTIGGYQVMKKWLSYREKELLGRGLKVEEAGEVRDMARRIAGILLMEPRLNANYEAVKGEVYEWRREE